MKKRMPAALLSDEDLALWRAVAKTVTPRPGSHVAAARDPGAPTPPVALPAATLPIKPAPTRPPSLAPLERRLIQRLARGRLAADAVLDLHGLRQHEAFVVLRTFLSRAQRDGAKLVLVVTGKGSGAPDEAGEERQQGVLRRAVPHWLAAPELRGLIVGFEQATRNHGGAGALYVRLRRHGPRDGDAR